MSTPQQRVPDEVVAAFRACLSGDTEQWTARNAALDRSPAGRRAYQAFICAMFTESVHRRLGLHPREARIIAFVADVRSRGDELADLLDPETTERLIGEVYDYADPGEIDAKRSAQIRFAIIVVIIRDEDLSETELNVFLERSRTRADEVLG